MLLGKLPSGTASVSLATKLGLWTRDVHTDRRELKGFDTKINEMKPGDLSREYAYWTKEYGRVSELVGMLEGQSYQNKLQAKRVRALAKVKYRQEHKNEKPSAGAVADAIEEDPSVLDSDMQTMLVETLLIQAKRSIDAISQYLTTISREITYRSSQSARYSN